jgi:predicted restriction endonuclease
VNGFVKTVHFTYQFAKTLSEEEIELIKEQRKSKEVSKEEVQDESLNYSEELEQTFNCPQIKKHEESHIFPDVIADPNRRREKVQEDIQNSKDIEPQRSERFKRVPTTKWEQKNCEARNFLKEWYDGKCQICNYSFTKRDGEPYFEGVYLVSRTRAAWIDRPGNVLCLCANCSTKFMYGAVEANNISEQINGFKCVKEGGTEKTAIIKLKLCSEDVKLIFTERHIVDLQEILKSAKEV